MSTCKVRVKISFCTCEYVLDHSKFIVLQYDFTRILVSRSSVFRCYLTVERKSRSNIHELL